MKAAPYREFRGPVPVETVPDPEVPHDGVVLKVLACGVCRSDWHAWTGADHDIVPPMIGGHEYCGVVVAAGPGCGVWKTGDRGVAPFVLGCGVCRSCTGGEATICATQIVPGFNAPGAFAEYVAVPRADFNLVPMPEDLPAHAAAALGCRVTTAFRALADRAVLRPGEWLAVHGCGGVGLSAVMLGRAMGARVIAVDVIPEKLALAAQLGAESCVNAAGTDPAEAIRELTGGGANVSVEALGLPVTFAASLACLAPLGRHVQIGMPTGADAHPPIPLDLVYSRQLALFGTRGLPAHRFGALYGLLDAGRINVGALVTERIALSGLGPALAALDGYAGAGVAVIDRFDA